MQLNDDLSVFNSFGRGKQSNSIRTNNCVIYTRVSTKEQADNNLSLTTQRKACELYAVKHGYSISGSFGGTYESAKNDERKEFNKMLAFVKKSREKISYIIVYSVDRFSRSGANAIYITEQLKKQGVSVVSVSQPTDANTSSGRLQQNIQYIFSEYDNQLRREKCMAGTKEALLRGDWCHKPPIGYSIVKKDGKRAIVVNESGKLIRKAFLWKANEKLSNEAIKIKLNALGLKLCHQRISAMFRNPFYCGIMTHVSLEGQVIEGNHEQLITKEIFLKVNGILLNNNQGYIVKHENEDVPLKNFLKCASCGQSMPGYIVKSKNLWYYKCRRVGCCNNKSAKKIHGSFLSLLEPFKLTLSSEASLLVKREIKRALSMQIKQKLSDEAAIKIKLTAINNRIDRLEERFILEEITKEQYLKFTEKYKQERVEVHQELEKCTQKVSNLDESIEKLLSFSSNLPSLWTSSDYTGKLNLQNLVFPKGIVYDKKNDECRTKEINPLFAYIAYLKQVLEDKKIGIAEIKFNYADLVAPPGVEPWHNPI